MKQKLITTSILTVGILALSGCGSSSSTTLPSQPTQATGGTAYYVDSAVEGVTVACGSTVSTTDVNGMFRYEDGKDCQFSVGGIALRTESGLYQDKVVIEDNLQTAQYLQSMDYDGNPNNGITIHHQTNTVMAQHNISHVPTNDQELADSVVAMQNANIGYHGDFVHEQEAQEHLNNTQNEHNGGGYNSTGQGNYDDQYHQTNTGSQAAGTPHQDDQYHQNDQQH